MTFREKEVQRLENLSASNYDFFDGEKDEALDGLEKALTSMVGYVNEVVNQQILLPLYQYRYEGEDLRDKTMELDGRRRSAHDKCIAYLHFLDNLYEKLGLARFTDIDTSDRYEVADFAGRFVSELYLNGTGRTMDDVALDRDEPYDTAMVRESIEEIDATIERDDDLEENFDEI